MVYLFGTIGYRDLALPAYSIIVHFKNVHHDGCIIDTPHLLHSHQGWITKITCCTPISQQTNTASHTLYKCSRAAKVRIFLKLSILNTPSPSNLVLSFFSPQLCSDGSAATGFGKLVQQVRGALPIVGLLSRLASPEGGIGNDDLAYTEYSRAVFDAAPQGFQIAVADLQNKHGKAAQRRYILLCLWMVQQGVGILPGKSIVDAARRLRVS